MKARNRDMVLATTTCVWATNFTATMVTDYTMSPELNAVFAVVAGGLMATKNVTVSTDEKGVTVTKKPRIPISQRVSERVAIWMVGTERSKELRRQRRDGKTVWKQTELLEHALAPWSWGDTVEGYNHRPGCEFCDAIRQYNEQREAELKEALLQKAKADELEARRHRKLEARRGAQRRKGYNEYEKTINYWDYQVKSWERNKWHMNY